MLPQVIFETSMQQLKHLVYLDRVDVDSPHCTNAWHACILYIMKGIVNQAEKGDSDDGGFSFQLCVCGYRELARQTPVVGGISESTFALAIRGALGDQARENKDLWEDEMNFSSAPPMTADNMPSGIDYATFDTATPNDEMRLERATVPNSAAASNKVWRSESDMVNELLVEDVFDKSG
ncbi:hypothetical protein OQA88_13175 [Cercophora sp. LCS_1]